MIDWTRTMEQTYEFYIVDPDTWKDSIILDNVSSCTIDWDKSAETLGSARIVCDNALDECYIRIYLIATQDKTTERIPLGTFLVQTPNIGFNGRSYDISIDAYTPLLELKDNSPPVGYTIIKGSDIMSNASSICSEHLRAPIIPATNSDTLYKNFVANLSDNWLTFITDLINNAKYELSLDALGQVMFAPIQDVKTLKPVWTFNDDNSSILLPDITIDGDIYGIPNVIEVVYSTNAGYLFSKVINDSVSSPISTVNRGREVLHRVTDVRLPGEPNQEQLDAYAEELLNQLSSLEYTVTYKHGYCPVRIGDCVYLNYTRAKLNNIKAVVISQSIDCKSGCMVTETAKFTNNLWRDTF